MSDAVDKVIVTNRQALNAKYGGAGLAGIDQALARLATSDAARDLTTRLIAIDDAAMMGGLGGRPVIAPVDEAGAKAAVDAIYSALKPDYIVLLDGPDVVPHISLDTIPGLQDGDLGIPSDLPYACSAPHGSKANPFVAVERVVGRLPAAEGETDPSVLVSLIDEAVAHAPQSASGYADYFAIGAETWTLSTQLSVNAIFHDASRVGLAPPSGHPAIDQDLGRLTHFVNCHGAAYDPRFYGQKDKSYPVAMESDAVSKRALSKGTVVAAECCFGAQLYSQAGISQPICMAYLRNGAAGFLGSTNIAYGKSEDTGQADLLCRYFLEAILAGASTGRALLQARQNFVSRQVMADPTNLKTLAQFVLLGDPSLQPVDLGQATVVPPVAHGAVAPAAEVARADARSQRKARRLALASLGKSVASAASLPGRRLSTGLVAAERFRALALEKGFGEPTLLSVTGGRAFRASMKDLEVSKSVIVSVDTRQGANDAEKAPFPLIRVMVGHILGDGLRVTETESR